MPKKLIQDIFVSKNNIKLVDVHKERNTDPVNPVKKPSLKVFFPEKVTDTPRVYPHKEKVSNNSNLFLWIISIILLGAILFLVSSKFATATITITPKTMAIALNDTYPITSDKTVTGLHFQVETIKKDLSKPLPTEGVEDVQRKAIGKAIIYNNYGSASQRLINNTRLEATDGRIYRIRQSVDIPGMTVINGIKTPGSVEVEIIADAAGDTYNMKVGDLKGDFTIPGFKGTTRYTAFYARLSSDLVGGYIGKVKKVAETAVTSGRQELQANLKVSLLEDLYSEMPSGYTVFKDSYYMKFSDLPDTSDNNGYQVSEEGVVQAIIFNKDELSAFIAKNKIKDFDGSKVDILWNDNALLTITGKTVEPWKENSLIAKFVGPVDVVWTYDIAEILNEIRGQNISVLNNVIEKNKDSIVDIKATIRPSWTKTFPKNITKIKVIDSVRDANSK